MTSATPATTSEIDLWRQQTRATGRVVGANLAGLTHEDSLVQPRPGGNCLNWVLGHLLTVYDGTLPLLSQEPVMGEEFCSITPAALLPSGMAPRLLSSRSS